MRHLFVFIAISLLFACKHSQTNTDANTVSAVTLIITDPSLSFKNGFWYYAENLFSGTIVKHFQDNTTHQSTAYQNGKEHGWQLTFYPGGTLSEKRYFNKGEKDSIHTGWWQNGNK